MSQATNKTHELKIAPHFLKEIEIGNKNFEIRFNDRNFQVGDTLILKGFENETYTKQELTRTIDFILEDYPGLEKGYVILSLKPAVIRKSEKENIESILSKSFSSNEYSDFMWAFKRFLQDDPDNAFYFIDSCDPIFNFFSKNSPLFLKAILYRESIDFSEITEGKYDEVLDLLCEAIWDYYRHLKQ